MTTRLLRNTNDCSSRVSTGWGTTTRMSMFASERWPWLGVLYWRSARDRSEKMWGRCTRLRSGLEWAATLAIREESRFDLQWPMWVTALLIVILRVAPRRRKNELSKLLRSLLTSFLGERRRRVGPRCTDQVQMPSPLTMWRSCWETSTTGSTQASKRGNSEPSGLIRTIKSI